MRNQNRRIVLASRPTGVPTPETFKITDAEIPEIADGEDCAHII